MKRGWSVKEAHPLFFNYKTINYMKTSVRLLGSVVLTLLVLAACTGKSKESQASIDPDTELVKGLTAKDTADFIGLAQVCMDTLQAGKIDDGLNMIYCIINDTLMPMTDEMRENMKQHFKRFPVKKYRMEDFEINGYSNNTVKYSIFFQENPESEACIKFAFNPIRIDDAWYLTLKNN